MEHMRFFTDQKALVAFLRKLRAAGVTQMRLSKEEMTFQLAPKVASGGRGEPREVDLSALTGGVKIVEHGAPRTFDQMPADQRIKFEQAATTARQQEDEELFWSAKP
jgi:hypothetical protein